MSVRAKWEGAQTLATRRGRLLVVDDEIVVLELLQLVLEGAGYDVVCCQGGRTALALLTEEHFDGILTDLVMPEVGGWEVYRELRERGSPLADRLILLTGQLLEPGIAELLEQGEIPCLKKPFNLDRLKEVVASRCDLQLAGLASR